MWAIRTQGVGKYFDAPLTFEGARHPREAWRSILRLFGIRRMAAAIEGEIQRTVAVPGQVLQDVSLEIEQGSVVCLAGSTGAGKSVLLRILAGLTAPTTGRVELRGSVSSLIRVGSQLNHLLTVSENIAQFRTFGRLPADPAFADRVIAFAELEEFRHAPVRTLSTGMALRLDAALALSGTPSILLLDDVLAVGDLSFQQRCVDRLHALRDAGCTIVTALSDEHLVEQLASRVVTLGNGRVVDDGVPHRWRTVQRDHDTDGVEWDISTSLAEDEVMGLRRVSLEERREGGETLLHVSHHFEARTGPLRCWPSVFLIRTKDVLFRSLYPQSFEVEGSCQFVMTVAIPTRMIPAGEYRIVSSMLSVREGVNYSLKAEVAMLHVHGDSEDDDRGGQGMRPLVVMAPSWEIEAVGTEQPVGSQR